MNLLAAAIGLGLGLGVLGTFGVEEVRWHWWAFREWRRTGRTGLTRYDWKEARR